MGRTQGGLTLHEVGVHVDDFEANLLSGLGAEPKSIPCKFFYDARGSALFEAITRLEEYYLTRTEVAIMRQNGAEMAEKLGPDCVLVEYGSGSSAKIRLLLDRLVEPRAYVPIDISRAHLVASADALAKDYAGLKVVPVWADYTRELQLPASVRVGHRRVVYFPGSTIGNFQPTQARRFLRGIAQVAGEGGGLLIGVDLEKSSARLNRAYDDKGGVTADFNLNVLVRANAELGADFDLAKFKHLAFYNPEQGRVEIYVVSQADQTVRVGGRAFEFAAGERVLTEYSYKYRLETFAALASEAGLAVERVWTDPEQLFSVQYLVVV